LGVFSSDLRQKCEVARKYEVNVYDHGKADIEPKKWWQALQECCAEAKQHLGEVGVVTMSVTTPGLTPMDAHGRALGPAILFFDGRSNRQAAAIRQLVGEDTFLRTTCNLPVTGGSSLCSILWLRENRPEVWAAAKKFGHTNTYLVRRMTGHWAIDPSTVSITGLYNTPANDLTWNEDVLDLAGIPARKLPTLMHSYEAVGQVLPEVAGELGLPRDAVVLCGGNDAVLAAFSGGLTEPGDINIICGTCDITNVCVDRPVCSPNFNVRCHVLPGRWVTFFVLNTGGKALEWFHSVFCPELTVDCFYDDYVPRVIEAFLRAPDAESREAELPAYVPFLAGSRYSLDRMKASFAGITLETTRDDLLMGLMRGNAMYHGQHLREVATMMPLGTKVMTSGGGAKIRGSLDVRKRWTGDFEYLYQDQCSLRGAAMLGQIYQSGERSLANNKSKTT
jgi:sugar (pentulose or hexulose) kinase